VGWEVCGGFQGWPARVRASENRAWDRDPEAEQFLLSDEQFLTPSVVHIHHDYRIYVHGSC